MRTHFHSAGWATVAFAIAGCSLTTKLSGLGSSSQGSETSGYASPASGGGTASPGGSADAVASAEESEGCPTYLSLPDPSFSPTLEPIITLLKCPNTTTRSSGDPVQELGSARGWIRSQLDTGLVDTSQLLRASYVHLCARQMKEDKQRLYPAMGIGCALQADRIDKALLTKELQARPAADRGVLANQVAVDIRTVHDRVGAEFPRTTTAREWEIFYELPLRVRKESLARRTANAKAYQRVLAFDASVQSGTFEGCAAPLREALTAYVRGGKTIPAITERLTDPVGYALAEALARCNYYNEQELKAGALLALLEKARRQVSLAEQVHYAQLDALAADAEKAEKFPNLVGTKYSSVKPSDLRPIEPWMPTKLEEQWVFHKSKLLHYQAREGRVAKIDATAKGAVIHFQKERVPLVDLKCRETNRIDKIDPDGKITYREVCTSTPKGMVWSNPAPVTVDEAGGVAAGRYVRIAFDNDQGVVASCTDSAAETARAYRVADLVLGDR